MASTSNVAKDAYVLSDSEGAPRLILITTGSELSLAVNAAQKLRQDGVFVRVVSMLSWELFEEQSAEYSASPLKTLLSNHITCYTKENIYDKSIAATPLTRAKRLV